MEVISPTHVFSTAIFSLNMTFVAQPLVIIVGGPAGTGKTTTARLLAEHYDCPFLEGDDFHPQANLEKMARGEPLTDDDRWDWLKTVSEHASQVAQDVKNPSHICIASCSMLKKVYRDYIKSCAGGLRLRFVFLHTSIEKLAARVAARQGHFMKLDMVQLQYDIMEVPGDAELLVNGGDALAVEMSDMTPAEVESYIVGRLSLN